MLENVVRRWLVVVWTACAALNAGGATYYVIDLSGGPNADRYPMEILEGEPSGGWTDEHKTTKLVLCRIDTGSFMMCNQVQVTLTRPFFIGVFEVTSAQYQLVMGRTNGAGDARPEAGISYNTIRGSSDWPNSSDVGADTFLGRLRAKTGLATFDLPTEAQWEYACRAGTTTDFNDGTNLANSGLDELGRYEGNGDDGRGEGDDFFATTVGSYQPNAWRLYDMHGNAREWCLDYYDDSLVGGYDPIGGLTGSRVVRGGSYASSLAIYCGASFRANNNPVNASEEDGFRVICYPAEIVQSVTPYEGTYDGEGHGITVNVSSPPTADISYAHSEAGPYQSEPILITNATAGAVTVWYKVEAVGYDTVISNSTVTITKATYDMSGVAWDYDEPFEGDGTVKTVVLTNLPTGVSATYTNNTATEPGTNTAHAVLSYDAVNYFEPTVPDLTWVILPPMELGVAQIVGYPTTVGSNGIGRVEGIVDTTASGLRSVWLTGEADNTAAWFEVVATNVTSVSFDWKCSCEELPKKGEPYDHLEFSIDGTRVAYIGGETDWTNVTFDVEEEVEHVFRWTYSKDVSDAEGDDCAWVANVVITYAQEPEIRFTSISAEEGAVTVAVSMMLGESAQAISSADVKNWLEATSDLSDWVGGALAITVEDLTQGVAETVRFRVTFQSAVSRAFLRLRE